MQLFKNEKTLLFVGGMVAALIGKQVMKSEAFHKFCVQGVATGMKLQKDALEKIQNIKEEATDLYMDENMDEETQE